MSRTKSRLIRTAIPIAAVVLLALLVGGSLIGASSAPSADELAIEHTCLRAMIAMQTLPIRISSHGMIIKAQSVESTDTSPVTGAQRQAMKDIAIKTLAKYYTGDMLRAKTTQMLQVIDHYTTSDVRFFGSGIDWIQYRSITVTGNTATVSARVQVWARKAQDQGHGKLVFARPTSQLDENWTLAKINNQWVITDETWSFAPGSEP
jgi:hypothetical protein